MKSERIRTYRAVLTRVGFQFGRDSTAAIRPWVRRLIIALMLTMAPVASVSVRAASADGPLPRRIIAFYDPAVVDDAYRSPVHQTAEIILNHLGLDVRHRSITSKLPSDNDMRGVRGVITWFGSDPAAPDPEKFCAWMDRQMRDGVRWVALENFGLFGAAGKLTPTCRKAIHKLGAVYKSEVTEDPLFLDIVAVDRDMVGFERELSFADGSRYALLKPVGNDVKAHLTIRRIDMDNSDSALVFTSKHGGYAHAGWVIAENKNLKRLQWIINPFRFFETALGVAGWPRPDVTTVNGLRIFMSHIDGDGIFNVSHIDRESYSGEIIMERVLKHRSDIPVSVSIITGYLDMPELNGGRERALYRDIFGLPNVELAAHGYAHPLKWRERTFALEIPGYTYDPVIEVAGAANKMRALLGELQEEKPLQLYFWTGDCLVNEAELGFAESAGTSAINGGEARFDARYDSRTHLSPIGISRGDRRQIYAAFPNENVFTNLWHGPYYGYRDVTQSFANTENPVRLKPIDVYYHFYSGERTASLKALDAVYDAALTQDIFPLFISEYIAMARDFFDAALTRLANGWRVGYGGDLATVRFDGEARTPDLTRSRGILGFARERGSLYVHLDGSGLADIYFHDATMTRLRESAAPQARPYVETSSFRVSEFAGNAANLSFFKQGWHSSKTVLGAMRPRGRYRVETDEWETVVAAGDDGRLTLKFPQAENGGPKTEVKVTLESD